MLKEFALDPSILGNWKDFRFFVGQFGVPQGRLISRFPADWKEMVIKAAEKSAKDVEYARIEDALTRIEKVMFIRSFDYQKPHKWLRNAAEENQRRPFHAIVSSGKFDGVDNYLIAEDLDPTNPHELWMVPTSVHINRTAEEMAACVKDLLSQCTEVLFIDPHFGPAKQTHIVTLQKFLEAVASRGARRMPTRIEYHCGNQDVAVSDFRKSIDTRIKPLLPRKCTFTVVRWVKSQMHNRYIITDRGGVMFGHGLGVPDGSSVTHDTVSLLDDKTCEGLMLDYSENGKRFSWLNELFSVIQD